MPKCCNECAHCDLHRGPDHEENVYATHCLFGDKGGAYILKCVMKPQKQLYSESEASGTRHTKSNKSERLALTCRVYTFYLNMRLRRVSIDNLVKWF